MLAFLAAQEMHHHTPDEVPQNFEEAVQGDESNMYLKAIQEVMESIVKNGVFEVQKLPPGWSTVRCKWVYDVKKKAEGNKLRYKARLVAKGFTQTAGVDYKEVFSPVTKYETRRSVLALVTLKDFELEHVDIKKAFLNGDLDEEIYMDPPPLPEELPDAFKTSQWLGKVWKLNCALYGLKQASKVWNDALNKGLKGSEFKQSEADPCLYVSGEEIDERVFLLVYVDDVMIAGKGVKACEEVKSNSQGHFDPRDLKAAQYFRGIKIVRDRRKREISISQQRHIAKIVEKFGMTDAFGTHVPMVPGLDLMSNFEREHRGDVPYRELIGCLIYVAVTTRSLWQSSQGILQHRTASIGRQERMYSDISNKPRTCVVVLWRTQFSSDWR